MLTHACVRACVLACVHACVSRLLHYALSHCALCTFSTQLQRTPLVVQLQAQGINYEHQLYEGPASRLLSSDSRLELERGPAFDHIRTPAFDRKRALALQAHGQLGVNYEGRAGQPPLSIGARRGPEGPKRAAVGRWF
jgi:hypothetical protein